MVESLPNMCKILGSTYLYREKERGGGGAGRQRQKDREMDTDKQYAGYIWRLGLLAFCLFK